MAARILVVEDDAAQLARVLAELRALGYEALGSSSAEEAIPLARDMNFDAVLTDNILPGMSGLRSIAEFAKVCMAPVMVMTSDPSAEGEKDAALMGARCYLSKPLNLERFQRELQAAERGKGSPAASEGTKMRISAGPQRLEPDETKILVVDDEEGIRRLFSRVSIRALSAARIVGSAAAAREAGFAGVSTAFIDVDLVEAGAGIGLAEELRSVEPNCRIYLMSGNPATRQTRNS